MHLLHCRFHPCRISSALGQPDLWSHRTDHPGDGMGSQMRRNKKRELLNLIYLRNVGYQSMYIYIFPHMCCIVGKVSLSFPTPPSIKTLIFRSRHPQLRRLHQQPLLKLWHRAEVLEECHLSPFLVGQQLNQPENQSFHSQKPGILIRTS